MVSSEPPSDRKSFRVAIICALPREADAVTLLFDRFWDEERDPYGRADGDTNTYITGQIGEHHVVLAVLPNMGTNSAAAATASLRSSYSDLKLAILVGICGGVPRIDNFDAFLGDVIVSKTIVQYDYGRQYPGHFAVKNTIEDSLGRPNKDIRSLLAEDKIYPPTYTHRHRNGCSVCSDDSDSFCESASKASCVETGCDPANLVVREGSSDRVDSGNFSPNIFIGQIGSGNTVIKSGQDRDRIAGRHNLIAFEMEGAGAWDEIPCIIVKGICDYADSHKNKVWQDFAAATAASVAKAILGRYQIHDGDRGLTQTNSMASLLSMII
ncbi:hypothetical protein ACHAPJ_007543 [Fusarium lateritium]